MWLLRACSCLINRRVAASPASTSTTCIAKFTSRSAAAYQYADFTPKNIHLSKSICPIFQSYHNHLKNSKHYHPLQQFPLYSVHRMHCASFSTCVQTSSLNNFNSVNRNDQKRIMGAHFHSTAWLRDIPDYLEGSISQVDNIFDNFLREEIENTLDDDMTEEIQDFLNSRLLLYEETETSFMLQCHKCSASTDSASRSQEIIVDKISGYYVCPWCCQAGTWEELCHMLDKHEDTITECQLETYFQTASDISEVDFNVLEDSPLQAVGLPTLISCGAKLSNDGTRVVFPLKGNTGKIVGFESVSLLHDLPQIVRRYVAGEQKPLFSLDNLKDSRRVVVVPTCCDVLTLAEYGIPSVSIPHQEFSIIKSFPETDLQCPRLQVNHSDQSWLIGWENLNALFEYLSSWKEVVVWLDAATPPPRQLLRFLISSQISCQIVGSQNNNSPIHCLSKYEVEAGLKNTIPIFSKEIVTFSELKDKVYHRLTNKEQINGVQWKRFSELNDILMGHRPGEITVLTGPTGSGKTTLMAEYSLDLCSQGVVTLWGSFEISVVRLCEIMLQQYLGAPLPVDLMEFNALASKFSRLPLHFLTYHGQQTTNSVLEAMAKAVQVWGVQHIIIDNLQFMLGTGDRPVDRWWEQDRAVAAFRRFATAHNCHLTLIVHPKKIPEGQLLGIDSIFGGAKVSQEADNILILQVKEGTTLNQAKKALQIVKNRFGGQLGILPLKFHRESLTLSSCFIQKSKPKDKTKPSQIVQNVKGIEAFM